MSRSQSLFKLLLNTFDKQNAELAYQFMTINLLFAQNNFEVKCQILLDIIGSDWIGHCEIKFHSVQSKPIQTSEAEFESG